MENDKYLDAKFMGVEFTQTCIDIFKTFNRCSVD